ncbi:TM2 domain-containing protein [Paracoccus aestuariivivens]|uniref:NINE protein n=1 Tax=Paracoccus aestuariivivens TaxID=1820333 RepID=A0A6L6J698_9RHOB|nr:TM2 domain-containing protein [Paracoccus aestuariivivens]MTH77632.1 NINE protein [Paracoccus aestuariivivens]
MSLTTQQQMLVEQRLANDAKSPVVAYLLLIFVGGLGAHRFYLGQIGTAIAMLIMFILGWLTLVIGVGLILLAAVGIWCLVDLFLIPGMIRTDRDALRERYSMQTIQTSPDVSAA